MPRVGDENKEMILAIFGGLWNDRKKCAHSWGSRHSWEQQMWLYSNVTLRSCKTLSIRVSRHTFYDSPFRCVWIDSLKQHLCLAWWSNLFGLFIAKTTVLYGMTSIEEMPTHTVRDWCVGWLMHYRILSKAAICNFVVKWEFEKSCFSISIELRTVGHSRSTLSWMLCQKSIVVSGAWRVWEWMDLDSYFHSYQTTANLSERGRETYSTTH